MSSVLDFIMYLGGPPPRNVAVPCPYVEGMPYDPEGFISQSAIDGRWVMTLIIASVLVGLAVVVCYGATRNTTGPAFARRWLVFLVGSSLLAGLVAWAVVFLLPYEVAAGTCDTALASFKSALPRIGPAIQAAVWRVVWSVVAFVALSLLLTRGVGRASWTGGFFHNRGTPYPRFFPRSRGS